MSQHTHETHKLEDVLLQAYEMDLITEIKITGDSITIKLNDTPNYTEAMHKLAKYIKKRYTSVKYFHFRRAYREMQIYHFRLQEHIAKLWEDENRL